MLLRNSVAADAAVLIVVAVQAILGWRYGLVRRCLVLFGMFPALLAASFSGNAFASAISPHSLSANAAAFLAVFVAVVIFFEVLGALYQERLHRLIVVAFDRISGSAAGVVIGIFQIAVIFRIVLATAGAPTASGVSVRYDDAAASIRSGVLSAKIVSVEPGVMALFTPVLPGNIEAHLADGTQAPTATTP